MKLKLIRLECRQEGVFGELSDESGKVLLYTLEHSYEDCQPKVPSGTYTCKRRVAKITHGDTFEIMGVKGHKDLLFHCGNFENDSDGCVLLGMRRSGNTVLQSREAFTNFMHKLEGVSEFQLEVSAAAT